MRNIKKAIFALLLSAACDQADGPLPTEQPEESPMVEVAPIPEPTPEPTVTEEEDCDPPAEEQPGQNCFCSFLCRIDTGAIKLLSKFEFAADEAEACGLIPDHVSCEVLDTCYCTCEAPTQ